MVRAFLLAAEYRGRFQGEPSGVPRFGLISALSGRPGRPASGPHPTFFSPDLYTLRQSLRLRSEAP